MYRLQETNIVTVYYSTNAIEQNTPSCGHFSLFSVLEKKFC